MEPGRVNQKLSAKQVSRRRENTPGAQGCWGTEVEKEEQGEEAEQRGLHIPTEGGDDASRVGRKRGEGGESEQSLRHSAGREKKSRVPTAGDVGVNELLVFKLGIM